MHATSKRPKRSDHFDYTWLQDRPCIIASRFLPFKSCAAIVRGRTIPSFSQQVPVLPYSWRRWAKRKTKGFQEVAQVKFEPRGKYNASLWKLAVHSCGRPWYPWSSTSIQCLLVHAVTLLATWSSSGSEHVGRKPQRLDRQSSAKPITRIRHTITDDIRSITHHWIGQNGGFVCKRGKRCRWSWCHHVDLIW